MATLIISGQIREQSTTLCNFTVSVDNGPFASADNVVLDQSFFTVPDQPVQVLVHADPVDAVKYAALQGTFQLDGAGNMSVVDAPEEFAPPVALPTPLGATFLLTVHFSAVRDVTEQARQALSPTGAGYPGSPPAPAPGDMSWRGPFFSTLPPADLSFLDTLDDITYIADPSVSGGQLQVETRSLAPQGEVKILEIAGVGAPRLVALYWPDAVARNPGAGPTPFLVYFHPTAGQNTAAGFYVDPRDRHDPVTGSIYPWGFDYQFFGFWRYLTYEGDSFTRDPFCKGLPYQIEASGKNAVLVLPLNKAAGNPCDEVLSFTDASFLQEHLQEIQSFMFRRAGNYQSPGLGRLGMASFSSGHSLLSCFLSSAANQAHPLYLDTLQEIYLFDPHADLASETLVPTINMAAWATRGAAATKVARLYTQNDAATLAPVLAQFGIAPAPAPFDVTAPLNGRRSVACLPLAAWNALATSVGSAKPYNNTGAVHQAISALMLTDAMRRSDF